MSNVLVAYFSASGVTKKVATRLAEEIGAELFEIVPETPYTAEDLNWQDKNSRPAIGSKIADIRLYDVIYVGFPVWWYREPSIIDTFMEAYDFSGKKVVPFATSGGSPMGDAEKRMQALAPKAKVAKGKRFAAHVSGKELSDWATEWLL